MHVHTKLTVCSFFSGGGLLDYAFQEEFEILWAVDNNPYAALCYQHNIGHHIVIEDIQKIPFYSIPSADVFIGGPPCQEFSSLGTNTGELGERGKLVWTYHSIIKAKMPKAFVMENVSGLARKHKHTLERLISAYESIGYCVSIQQMDAYHFGAGQHRKRVFLIGIRKDLQTQFTFPSPTSVRTTVKHAIGDLPEPVSIRPREKLLGFIPNHTTSWTNPTPERIQDLLDNPRPNQHTGIRRLHWEKPSHTLTAHMAKDGREFIHPNSPRRITVRETLRLMGMPDDFLIPVSVPLQQQYTLAGNGVSYPVGKALSAQLHKQLTQSSSCKVMHEEQLSLFDFLQFDTPEQKEQHWEQTLLI